MSSRDDDPTLHTDADLQPSIIESIENLLARIRFTEADVSDGSTDHDANVIRIDTCEDDIADIDTRLATLQAAVTALTTRVTAAEAAITIIQTRLGLVNGLLHLW